MSSAAFQRYKSNLQRQAKFMNLPEREEVEKKVQNFVSERSRRIPKGRRLKEIVPDETAVSLVADVHELRIQ